MSDTLWVILGMAVVTYATRASLLLAGGRVHLSPRLEQALRYLPVALLTAIVVPALLVRNDALALTTKNVLWTVLTGLLFVLAWRTFGL